MSEANKTQVAGGHYQSKIQHWDFVVANDLNYFEGQITKYVTRCRKKNGLQDLEKAQHFLAKYIELVKAGVYAPKNMSSLLKAMRATEEPEKKEAGEDPGRNYINQD